MSTEVPSEIAAAAQLVENYFASNGVKYWALMGVCSRNHLTELEDARAAYQLAQTCAESLLKLAKQYVK